MSDLRTTARDHTREMLKDGYLPGAPAHLRPETVAIDRGTCRQLRCERCGRQGLAFRPFHNGAGRYRVLGVCPGCDHATEM